MKSTRGLSGGLIIALTSFVVGVEDPASHPAKEVYETHVQNLKQLTFGGQNAEAYFSFDGANQYFNPLDFLACDQIFSMNIYGSDVKLLNSGKGCTIVFFFRAASDLSMPPPF
jgi:hypothetical protein